MRQGCQGDERWQISCATDALMDEVDGEKVERLYREHCGKDLVTRQNKLKTRMN